MTEFQKILYDFGTKIVQEDISLGNLKNLVKSYSAPLVDAAISENLQSIVILDYTNCSVQIYQTPSHIEVNDEYIMSLGYNLDNISWMSCNERFPNINITSLQPNTLG